MESQWCETKQTKNENELNHESHSNDEQYQEQLSMFRLNLGWHPDYEVKDEGYPKQTEGSGMP